MTCSYSDGEKCKTSKCCPDPGHSLQETPMPRITRFRGYFNLPTLFFSPSKCAGRLHPKITPKTMSFTQDRNCCPKKWKIQDWIQTIRNIWVTQSGSNELFKKAHKRREILPLTPQNFASPGKILGGACSLAVMPLLRCIYLRYSTSLVDSENATLVVTLSSCCLSTVLLYINTRCFVNKSVLLSQSSCQVTLIIRSL